MPINANIYDYLEIQPDGSAEVNLAALNRDSAKGLVGYTKTKAGTNIKLVDTLKALELLGRHLGLFAERHEHDLGDRKLYVELAEYMGLKSASRQELEASAKVLDEGKEEPRPQ